MERIWTKRIVINCDKRFSVRVVEWVTGTNLYQKRNGNKYGEYEHSTETVKM